MPPTCSRGTKPWYSGLSSRNSCRVSTSKLTSAEPRSGVPTPWAKPPSLTSLMNQPAGASTTDW